MQGPGELAMRLKEKIGLHAHHDLASPQMKTKCGAFSVTNLIKAKQLALRRKVWFRSLSRLERGILDLTIRYVDSVKSTLLAKVLTAVLEKLQLATENVADRLVRLIGFPLAKKASQIATSWGNMSALAWAKDAGFARYLAFNSAGIHTAIQVGG